MEKLYISEMDIRNGAIASKHASVNFVLHQAALGSVLVQLKTVLTNSVNVSGFFKYRNQKKQV